MSAPTLLPRTAWTIHGRPAGLVPFNGALLKGVALHWPGTTGPIGDPGSTAIAGRLEGYRRFHTGAPPVGRGWNDIAYNVAADQAGRLWDLRSVLFRSAANGTATLNGQWIAVLLLVGPGEQPSAALVDAMRWLRSRLVLGRYPNATRVVGHGDIRPGGTACPGPATVALIRAGAFTKAWAAPAVPRPRPSVYVLTRPLSLGTTGRDVAAWQQRLNRDLPDIRVDGDFGPVTDRSTMRWQAMKGLPDDGIVGARTAGAAGWVYRPKATSGQR